MAFMKNCVADQGEVFPVISRSPNTRAQIQSDGVAFEKKKLFSNRAVSTMQVWAIHLQAPTT